MRISRPCYDKPHRCPGWAGGGTRRARRDRCPDGGSLARGIYYRRSTIDPPIGDGTFEHVWWWQLRPSRCPKCGIIVLPYIVRWVDWRWWGWVIR